ncbi:MAG: hypothetical protein H3C43_10350 [Leptonema sp. (in: Bacteria)]|nr:hypothetical protein [Leptonema sp. (in: bacteria)]
MLSILRSKFFPFYVIGVLVLIFELTARNLPLYLFEKSEASLIESTRLKIESGKNQYQVLIFGDSRSMSLNPRFGSDRFSDTYNFSLPAMGPRYYKRYLQKYLAAGNQKPKVILFSGSPMLLMAGKGQTLVDPTINRYAKPDISLLDYLKNRGPNRLFQLENEMTTQQSTKNKELDWAFFSGRYLRMFSIADTFKDYVGPERLFLISAMIPMLFDSYRYRDAILNAMDPLNYRFVDNGHGTDNCNCQLTKTPQCLPPPSYYQDDLLVEQSREHRNGMYNISDRMSVERLQALELSKERLIDQFTHQSQSKTNPNYTVLEEFLNFLEEQQIQYYYFLTPFPEYFRDSAYITNFEATVTPIFDQHPNAHWIRHQAEFLNPEFFSDQVHLNCQGAELLNQEFVSEVLPQLYRLERLH